MESVIIRQQQPTRFVELIHEIVEIKRQQQVQKLVKLYEAIEYIRQQERTEEHICRLQVLLEQVRIQREILGQWPTTRVLREQLQTPVFQAAIEELLLKQQLIEETTTVGVPTPLRRRLIEQTIEEELVEMIKLQKERLPWTTTVEEIFQQIPMWNTIVPTTMGVPTLFQEKPYHRLVEQLLEQVELVQPCGIYGQQEVRPVFPLIKEIIKGTTVVPRHFFEQEKLVEKLCLNKEFVFPQQEKLTKKQLIEKLYEQEYLAVPHFFEEKLIEKIYKKEYLMPEEKLVKKLIEKEFLLPEEKLIKKQLIEKIYKQEYLLPRLFNNEEMLVEKKQWVQPRQYTTVMPRHFEEELLKEQYLVPEMLVKKEKEIVLPRYTTMVPRHFLGQEEKLVEKLVEKKDFFGQRPYTVVPRGIYGEEEMIVKKEKEIVLPRYTTMVPRHFLGEEEKLVEKKEYFVQRPYTVVPRGIYGEEEMLVKKEKEIVLPRYTTMLPRHIIGEEIIGQEYLRNKHQQEKELEKVVRNNVCYNVRPHHLF